MTHIKDSTLFITGANRGIGKAYAEVAAEQGVRKIYLGVRNPDTVDNLVAKDPERFIPIKIDVTNLDDVKAAALIATDTNILINNAGILYPDTDDLDETIDNARKQWETNYLGPLQLTRLFAPHLETNGKSHIVIVSSIVGHIVFPGIHTYCASKFATTSLILGLRQELFSQGIKVTGVYPGPIDTDMGKAVEMEKYAPSLVAAATYQGMENNMEEVFPDPFSKQMYQSYREDYKAIEQQMLDMSQAS